MAIKFCYRHPAVIAKTRCYHCKKDICLECRRHLNRHYFCGRKCYLLFRLQQIWAPVKKRKFPILLGWNAVLTLGLLALALYLPGAGSVSPGESPALLPVDAGESLPVPRPDQIDSLARSGQPFRSEILAQKTYDLNLSLERGAVLTVWRNDWPILSQIVSAGGAQRFPLPLQYGRNLLRIGVWNERQQLVYEDHLEITYKNSLVEALRYPVVRGNRQRRQLSLTFDGGSTAEGAKEILTILQEKQVVTTMFLTGQFIEKYPELVLEMVNAGHEIGNHTYDHPHLTTFEQNRRHDNAPGVTREYLQRQLLRTDSLFNALVGRPMKPYWRAAFGEYNQEILDWAAEAGFRHIGWSNGFDTHDWVNDENSALYKTPEVVRDAILDKDDASQSLNGAIVLMHLGTERQNGRMYTMLAELIGELRSRGFELSPVGDLLVP